MKTRISLPSAVWLFYLLTFCAGPVRLLAGTETLIPVNSVWRYSDAGLDLGTAWRELGFSDTTWASGPAELGYGDATVVTSISYGPNSSAKYPCYYFRRVFNVSDPGIFSDLSLRVLKDDGCVVYLNGQEVARYNMPTGDIAYSTYASGAADYDWDPAITLPNTLVAGDNVVAVEVHQGNATSSDVRFNLELVGSTAIGIHLDAPAEQAGEVPVPAELKATVSHPDGAQLNVAFYGRPAPADTGAFTIAVLPDTQNYSQYYPAIFDAQTLWIRESASALNTVFVCHEGDLVNTASSDSQYNNALHSMSLLDGYVPYGVLPGNHDQPTDLFNRYFPYTRFAGQPWYGGHYPADKNDNSYQLFTAGGLDFIVIHMEFWPSASTIQWANTVLAAHQDRHAILVTHGYLDETGARNVHVMGSSEYLWTDLIVPNPNLNLVLCGHVHAEYTRTDVLPGNRVVHQILADYQSDANGGNGWLRTMTFVPAYNQIQVKTVSPYLNAYKTGPASEFTLDYDMGAPAFALIQENSGVLSGAQTTATWTGINVSTDYEWYVAATDGVGVRASEIRRFRTTAGAPPAAPSALAATPQSSTSIGLSWTDNSDSETGFEIERSLDGFTFSNIGLAPSDATSAVAGGLLPDTTYYFQVRAVNGAGNSEYSEVASATTRPPNHPPVADSQVVTTDEDTPVAVILSATDLENDPLNFVVLETPGHGTLSGVAPSLTYLPATNYSGSDSFTFQAFDGADYSVAATVTVTMSPVNDPPTAAPDTATTLLSVPVRINVLSNDTDVDGLALTIVDISAPANGSVTVNADQTLTYQPDPGFIGQDTFTYTASDGFSTAVGTVTVTVKPNVLFSDGFESGNFTAGAWVSSGSATVDGSAANTGSYGALLKKSAAITKVLRNVGPGSVTLSYARRPQSLETTDLAVVEVSSDGQVWSSPVEILQGTSGWELKQLNISLPGNDLYVRFRLDGDTGNDVMMVDDVAVTGGGAANSAPVAAPEDYSMDEDTVLEVPGAGVLGNDTDPDGDTLSAVLVSGPAHGSLNLSPDGSFSYTPNSNFNGTDSFTYRASDGMGQSAPAAVSITVSSVNDAPVGRVDSYATEYGVALNVAAPGVLANDTDADGDALTAALQTGVAHGSLTLNSSGSFVYQPDAGYSGADGFVYTVNDGHGGMSAVQVNLTVRAQASTAMHVSSIVVTSQDAGKGAKNGYAEVSVVDANGNPVEGALVAAAFSETIQEDVSGITGAGGKAVLVTTATGSGRCRLTFTVTGVSKSGYTYDAAANVETTDKNY